jgi:hypothetical protein
MKTDAFIDMLVTDIGASLPNLRLRLLAAAAVGAALSIALLIAFYGIRPHLAVAITTWHVALKFVVALTLAATGAVLALRLTRPEVDRAGAWLILSPAPIILAAAGLGELMVIPPGSWLKQAFGLHPIACLLSVPVMSALPLFGILCALREGASAVPAQMGAAAGAVAAGIGSAIYALHCPDDSPLFLAVWYVLAAILVVAAGRAGGARLLRW